MMDVQHQGEKLHITVEDGGVETRVSTPLVDNTENLVLFEDQQMNDMDRMCVAYWTALESDDESTQNGAAIWDADDELVASGFNHYLWDHNNGPVPNWMRQRPTKYAYVEHAERAAIHNAARLGKATEGGTMYSPWAACTDCARAIVGSGITTLVRHKQAMDRPHPQWADNLLDANDILEMGGVTITEINQVFDGPDLRFRGKQWTP